MNFTNHNGIRFSLKPFVPHEAGKLLHYFQNLSAETISRFRPHPFDMDTIQHLFNGSSPYLAFVAESIDSQGFAAYFVVKPGLIFHHTTRFISYGISTEESDFCTFAPSVSDQWQGSGIGSALFNYMLPQLKANGFRKVVLWGGVQADNLRALAYYKKLGFRQLGSFEQHGLNFDMLLEF